MGKLRLHLAIATFTLSTLTLSTLSTYTFSVSNSASLDCKNIDCDCSSLPSESWKSICQKKQKHLRTSCQEAPAKNLGYCSIHGPKANRIPINLNLSTSTEQSNSIKLLSYKFAAIYWAIYKDMDFIEAAVNEQKYAMADNRLEIFQHNTNHLFDVQKMTITRLKESGNAAEQEKSWRNYSEDMEAVAIRLEEYADLLLDGQYKNDNDIKLFAIKLTASAGDLYEQVGYTYSQGARHKLSAQAWKKSANIASLLLSYADDNDNLEKAEYYRYQAATRLHRASYNWSLGIDKENARSALVEAQNYMDDKDDLNPLIKNGSVVSN